MNESHVPFPIRISIQENEEREKLLQAFDALPIDCFHLSVIFGSAENPTSRLPNLLVEGLAADADSSVVSVDISAVFKRCDVWPASSEAGGRFAIERQAHSDGINNGRCVMP